MRLWHWVAALAAGVSGFIALGHGDRVFAQAANRQYGTQEIQTGFRLYGEQCSLCHGGNGDGVAGVSLARQQFRRASSDADIRNTIVNGVSSAGMPSFRLAPAELDGLIAFIRSGFDLSGAAFTVGDAARGKAVYDGKGGCAECHRVRGSGSLAAPDLTDIGTLRRPAVIQATILRPNESLQPINRPVRIVMNDGRTIEGRRLNEDTATVQLIDRQARLVSLSKSDMRSFEAGAQSAMPSYAGKLSDGEVADLLAYLLSLKG